VAGATTGGAHAACTFDCRNEAGPMTITTRLGTKLRVPSTFQIKHQLLLFWLKNQVAKEAAEDKTDMGVAGRNRAMIAEGPIQATRPRPSITLAPTLLVRAEEGSNSGAFVAV
jgi:hypothetical protein